MKKNRFKPLGEIINDLPVNIHVQTAWKALKEHGMDLYVAAKKPNITPRNIQKHKDWCKIIENWIDDD
jgi:Transposase